VHALLLEMQSSQGIKFEPSYANLSRLAYTEFDLPLNGPRGYENGYRN